MYFIVVNAKISIEFMMELLLKIPDVSRHIPYLSLQHCVSKKPKHPGGHADSLHGTTVISVLIACPALNLKKYVVHTCVSCIWYLCLMVCLSSFWLFSSRVQSTAFFIGEFVK